VWWIWQQHRQSGRELKQGDNLGPKEKNKKKENMRDLSIKWRRKIRYIKIQMMPKDTLIAQV